jgi:ribosomal protein S18 acetylase RimI-like enzyme
MTQPKTPERLDDALQTRNMPRGLDEWETLLDGEETVAVETDVGEMALVRERGQLQLHYAFDSLEAMKQVWHSMFDALRPQILESGYPYVLIDLVEHPNRRWIEGLLAENDFEALGDWLEFVHNDVRDLDPPAIPDGLTMRKGGEADHEVVLALEAAAYGDFTDGATATRARLERAGWLGVLERDGAAIAYALNSAVEGDRGTVLSGAVAPDEQGEGLGKLILGAASFQLASAGARIAEVRVRPDIPQGARVAQALGYRVGRRGVELRRDSDEAVLAQRRADRQGARTARVHFGGWR